MISITRKLIKGGIFYGKESRELLNDFMGGLQEVEQTNGNR